MISKCQVTPALAKVLLHTQKWFIPDITARHQKDSKQLLIDSRILPPIKVRCLQISAERIKCYISRHVIRLFCLLTERLGSGWNISGGQVHCN